MRPELIAGIFAVVVPLFGGLYATLLGFRLIGPRPGVSPKYEDLYNRRGKYLKAFGPILILFGLYSTINDISDTTWIPEDHNDKN